jgi:tRNA pseudouridine synthase 10
MKVCNKCWTRNRLNRLASKDLLPVKEAKLCDLCEGLASEVAALIQSISNKLSNYEFNTVNIGLIIPSRLLEREDELRALTKARTAPTIKKYLAGVAVDHIERILQKRVHLAHINADIFVLLDLIRKNVGIISRPLYALGRYTKEKRGLPLRLRGDHENDSPSIEKILGGLLREYFQADDVKFTWIGGEDRESLVLGKGRPFLAKIIQPKRRTISESFRIDANERIRSYGLSITEFSLLARKPREPLRYSFTAEILCATFLDPEELPALIVRLPVLRSIEVTFEKSYAANKRRSLLFLGDFKLDGTQLRMKGTFEGGFDLKAFFQSEPGRRAMPSAEELLGLPLRLVSYDVLEVNFLISLNHQS